MQKLFSSSVSAKCVCNNTLFSFANWAVFRINSVDTPIGGDDENKALLDIIADERGAEPENQLQTSDMKLHIIKWLEELNPKQTEVLERRFGLLGNEPATLEDVGIEIGLTRERVRQIQVEALKRLKDVVRHHGLDIESLFTYQG